MKTTIIFYFDDTLVRSEYLAYQFENSIIERMGEKPMTREIHKATWGLPLSEAISKRCPGIDAEKFMDLVEQYISSGDNNKLNVVPPDNIDVLKKLKQNNIRMFILTSRSYKEIKPVLENYDSELLSIVERIDYADVTKYKKPDPRVFEKMFKEENLSKSNSIYVGDSFDDASAALNFGIDFVATLESGLREKGDFIGLGVRYYVNNMSELLNLVNNI